MHQRPPFRLTQTHRFEAFIQPQPPGPGGPVQKGTKKIDIVSLHGRKSLAC